MIGPVVYRRVTMTRWSCRAATSTLFRPNGRTTLQADEQASTRSGCRSRRRGGPKAPTTDPVAEVLAGLPRRRYSAARRLMGCADVGPRPRQNRLPIRLADDALDSGQVIIMWP